MEGIIGDDALKYSQGLRIPSLSEMAEPYETVRLDQDRIQRQGAFELSLCIGVVALAQIQLTKLLPYIDVVTACLQGREQRFLHQIVPALLGVEQGQRPQRWRIRRHLLKQLDGQRQLAKIGFGHRQVVAGATVCRVGRDRRPVCSQRRLQVPESGIEIAQLEVGLGVQRVEAQRL